MTVNDKLCNMVETRLFAAAAHERSRRAAGRRAPGTERCAATVSLELLSHLHEQVGHVDSTYRGSWNYPLVKRAGVPGKYLQRSDMSVP